MRPTILNTLKCLSGLKNDDITIMPTHMVQEWKEFLTNLERLTATCFEKKSRFATSKEPNVPVIRSRDAIPSTSGVSRDAIPSASVVSREATTTTTTTTTTTITITTITTTSTTTTTMNESIEEQDFGTQNTAYLEAELVEVVPTVLYFEY